MDADQGVQPGVRVGSGNGALCTGVLSLDSVPFGVDEETEKSFQTRLDLRKGLVQAFKQGFFFVDCQHDRAPFLAKYEISVCLDVRQYSVLNITNGYTTARPAPPDSA